MPQPNNGQVHVDSILTNISVAFMQDQSKYIASKVFPVVTVQKQSDKYFTYGKNDWLRDEAMRRAPMTESAGSGYSISTDSYNCDIFAFHEDIDDKIRKNADSPIQLDTEASQFVMSRILLKQEVQWVTDFFTTGIWGTDATLTNTWDDYSNSDPIVDIDTGKETVLAATGFEPNTLVIGWQVWRQLKNHPIFIERIKYTSDQNVSQQIVARMLELDNLYVAKSIKATNVEGATAATAFIHGKKALLCYVPPSPGLLTPAAGYTFAWDGVSDGIGQSVGTKTIRMENLGGDRIESESAWDNKVIASELGYYVNAAVA